MPGGRSITADDALAQLRTAVPGGADERPLTALADEGRSFTSLSALRRACPPELLGLSPGAWEAIFAPLFGEFE